MNSTLNFTRKNRFRTNREDIHSFSVNSFISKVFFPSTICIFVFMIATTFARDSGQQYPFMDKCNSTLNTLSSIANQTAGLSLAMRFYFKRHATCRNEMYPQFSCSFFFSCYVRIASGNISCDRCCCFCPRRLVYLLFYCNIGTYYVRLEN